MPNDSHTLMLVTDRTRSRLPLPDLVRLAVEGGVNAVQVREKDLSESELIALTGQIVEAAGNEAWVVVNGSLATAEALGIGVHLPERGSTVDQVRASLGSDVIVGRSVHSLDEAVRSKGADYLIAGPIFATKSKPLVEPMSMRTFEAISDVAEAPVFAIGGIAAASIDSILNLGAHGVAVIGAIIEADDPRAAAADLRNALKIRVQDHV